MQNKYVSVKGDPVDEALAKFIRDYGEKHKLHVMFIWLSPGIYSFGRKKLAIKVENGNPRRRRLLAHRRVPRKIHDYGAGSLTLKELPVLWRRQKVFRQSHDYAEEGTGKSRGTGPKTADE